MLRADLWLEHIFPLHASSRSERKLLRQIDSLFASTQDPPTIASLSKVPIEIVEKYHEQELQRRKDVEHKASMTLLAISLSFTVMFSVLSLLINQHWLQALRASSIHWLWSLVIVLAFLYLLAAGQASLRAIRVGKLYAPSLEQECDLAERGDAARRSVIAECVILNRLTTLMKSNYVDSGHLALLNGILFLALGLVVALLITLATMGTGGPATVPM